MNNLIEKIKDNLDYFDYHNKNLTKEQESKIEDIKGIVDKLENINLYYEVARCEVECAMEDIMNDELYQSDKDTIEKISEEEINSMAWRVEDYCGVWDDVYEIARGEVLEVIDDED